jgi:leader peptidase (prepilin peptidase) / N-methyltransferase
VAALALALAGLTVATKGADANDVAWGGVQALLVVIAAEDIRTRRIRNVVVGSAGVLAVLARLAFAADELVPCLVAGLVAFLVFLVLALIVRGGIGMGDVKLAGLIGLLLGGTAAAALFIGTVAGGAAAVVLLVRSRSRRATYAYGPYLCFGAACAILALDVPRLV